MKLCQVFGSEPAVCTLCMRICHLHCPCRAQPSPVWLWGAGEWRTARCEKGCQHVAFTGAVWDRQPCTLRAGKDTKLHSHPSIVTPPGSERADSSKDKHSRLLATFAVGWKEMGKEFCCVPVLLFSILLDKAAQTFRIPLDLNWSLFKAQW